MYEVYSGEKFICICDAPDAITYSDNGYMIYWLRAAA